MPVNRAIGSMGLRSNPQQHQSQLYLRTAVDVWIELHYVGLRYSKCVCYGSSLWSLLHVEELLQRDLHHTVEETTGKFLAWAKIELT
jgi:hypothetical protein